MAEIELEGDKRLQRRFSRWGAKLRDHGVYAGTSHKRIVIPKRFLNEDHIKELGFQPVLVAIPEAGQDQFASYRHPNNLFHIHSHGDRWTMHEDSHPAATMLMQQGVNPVSAIVQGLPHVLGEGAPGLANFLGGVLKGRESTADAVAQEAKGIKTAGLRRKEVDGVAFVIDRPKGFTKTWGDKSFTYPVDYGYFPGIDGEDGEGLDAFVGDTLDGHYECFQKLKPGDEGAPVLDETKFLVAVDDASREKIYALYGDEVHARQVLNGMNGVKGALKKFKKTKKERYVEQKTAATEQEGEDPKHDLAIGTAGVVGGAALANRAVPHLTGRTRLYHGTTPETLKKIQEQGLLPASERPGAPALTEMLAPDIRDDAKKLVYLERSPSEAGAYAAKAEHLAKGRGMSVGEQLAAELKGQLSPFQKGVGKADVPLWHKDIADKLRPNPEARGSLENFKKFHRGAPEMFPGQLDAMHALFSKTINLEGGLDPKYIRGAKSYQGVTLNELKQYIHARPGSFAKGLGLAAAGTAAAGYGASRLHDLYKDRQEKVSMDEQEPVLKNKAHWAALLPGGSSWIGYRRGEASGRAGEGLVRGMAGGTAGGYGGALAGAFAGSAVKSPVLSGLLSFGGALAGNHYGTHYATRGLLDAKASKKEASLRGARAVLAALKVSDVKAADIDKLLSGSVLGATGSNGAAEAASDEDRLMRMFRDADAKVGPTGEENGMSLPQEGSLGLA